GSFKDKRYLMLGKRLRAIDVDWQLMLRIQLHKFRFRLADLRNDRKLVIIDGNRGFIGYLSLINCATKITEHAGIDYIVVLTGPIVVCFQSVFAVYWYTESGEYIEMLTELEDPGETADSNYLQLIPSGPGYTTEPNLRMFTSLIHHAKSRLIICSPYFVPDEALLDAVTTAAYRDVRVELYVSRRADQFVVDHSQSSYYQTLLEAGVHIYQ